MWLGHGGILKSAQSPAEFSVLYFFQTLVQPAVNCFVLISGYVGYREEKYYPRLKNILSLLLIVLLYSVSITVICKIVYPDLVSVVDLLKACIPTLTKQYWFFTVYFGWIIISPLLNVAVHHADKKQSLIISLVFVFFSCFSLIKDPFPFGAGYSVIWFVFLYLMGAMIKKHYVASAFSKKVGLSLSQYR